MSIYLILAEMSWIFSSKKNELKLNIILNYLGLSSVQPVGRFVSERVMTEPNDA
tara:strand:+ start:191 stop:352 length:162 start_codon:yes stop_codon:yes gene_type:complete